MRSRRHAAKKAVTLIELLVASGVLSLFLLGTFYLYRSGSQSFALGAWKTKAQKEAQVFLEGVRNAIEKSGNGPIARDNEMAFYSQPLFMNPLASGTPLNIWNLGETEEVSLGFFSIFSPCTLHSTIALDPRPGSWQGGHLLARKRQLVFMTTNDPTILPPALQAKAPPLGGDFIAVPPEALLPPLTVNDVETFSYRFLPFPPPGQVVLTLSLRRPDSFAGTSYTRVEQSIRANLLHGATIDAL